MHEQSGLVELWTSHYSWYATGVKLGRLPTIDFCMLDLYGYFALANTVKYICNYMQLLYFSIFPMFVFTDILGRSNTGRNFLDYTAESGTLKRSRLIFKLRPAAQAQQLASLAKSERCWDDSLGPTSRAMNAFRRWWRCLKELSIWNRGRASGDAEKIVSS